VEETTHRELLCCILYRRGKESYGSRQGKNPQKTDGREVKDKTHYYQHCHAEIPLQQFNGTLKDTHDILQSQYLREIESKKDECDRYRNADDEEKTYETKKHEGKLNKDQLPVFIYYGYAFFD